MKLKHDTGDPVSDYIRLNTFKHAINMRKVPMVATVNLKLEEKRRENSTWDTTRFCCRSPKKVFQIIAAICRRSLILCERQICVLVMLWQQFVQDHKCAFPAGKTSGWKDKSLRTKVCRLEKRSKKDLLHLCHDYVWHGLAIVFNFGLVPFFFSTAFGMIYSTSHIKFFMRRNLVCHVRNSVQCGSV